MNRRGFLKTISIAMVGTAVAGTGVFIRKNNNEDLLLLSRRIYPELIVGDLHGIQPLSGPTGIIFYLDFKT